MTLFNTKTDNNTKIVVSWFLNNLSSNKPFPNGICDTITSYAWFIMTKVWIEIFLFSSFSDCVNGTNNKLLKIRQLEEQNEKGIQYILQTLFPLASKELKQFKFHSETKLNTLLNASFEHTAFNIYTKLEQYLFEQMKLSELQELLDDLQFESNDEIDFEATNKRKEAATKIAKLLTKDLFADEEHDSDEEDEKDGHETLQQFLSKKNVRETLKNMKNIMSKYKSDIDVVLQKDVVVDIFYQISGFDKKYYYHVALYKPGYGKYFVMDGKNHLYATNKWRNMSQIQRTSVLQKLFSEDQMDVEKLFTDIRNEFSDHAAQILAEALVQHEEMFIERKNEERFNHHYEKATAISNTLHVRSLKAVWYHGINDEHKIFTGDSLDVEHITALECYAADSNLCFLFRETYRKKDANESLEEQKKNDMNHFA
eukprot:536533_1